MDGAAGRRRSGSGSGRCPGSYERAGKHNESTTRKGNTWLRRALVEAACAAARNKETCLAAGYRRLLVRRKRRAADQLRALGYEVALTPEPHEAACPRWDQKTDFLRPTGLAPGSCGGTRPA